MEKEILIKRIKWRMETMLIKYKKWVKEKNNEKKGMKTLVRNEKTPQRKSVTTTRTS